MAKISYIDNNFRLVRSVIGRNYTELASELIKNRSDLTFFCEKEEMLAGVSCRINDPLSDTYGFICYTVKFVFANFDTLHLRQQEELCIEMLHQLKHYMEQNGGYYILRIPSHVVDLIKAINQVLPQSIFCGGTVEEFTNSKASGKIMDNPIRVFEPEAEYIEAHLEELLAITYKSFESYQGQYHISPVTDEKAGIVYKNWIDNSLKTSSKDKIIVSESENRLAGFVTVAEDDFAVEAVLAAVDSSRRKTGAYKSMISYLIDYAYDNGKVFVSSTQFDNYIVQGTWNSLGMKPFYSIYNLHFDYRSRN